MAKIQWNKVTWYSKLIALIIFVIFPFVGFYWGTQYGEALQTLEQTSAPSVAATAPSSSGSIDVSAYYENTAAWQTDQNNTSGGFTIAYPLDFNVTDNYSAAPSTDWRLNSNGVPGIQYFTLTVPQAFEPQTNFADAMLTVGASQNNTAIAECLKQDQTDGPATATTTATIRGVPFTVFTSDGAGAGNYYQTTSYRTLHAGECYAVEYTIHSGQIANYPPQYDLQPFDQEQIQSVLQRIVSTFKFD
jgi:hypothetical protein